AREIGARALGVAAFDLVGKKLEIAGQVARRLAGPVQQRAAQNVERAGTILQARHFTAPRSRRGRLVAHPVELFGADKETNRIARRVVFFLWRRTALEADD